jgi:hypothetical protein
MKFRQGEVWVAIRDEFEACGLRPTRPDRERLASGIELAERLAVAVRDAQAALLAKELGAAAQKEAALFEGMRAQRKLEQEARFYTVSRWMSGNTCVLCVSCHQPARHAKMVHVCAYHNTVKVTSGGKTGCNKQASICAVPSLDASFCPCIILPDAATHSAAPQHACLSLECLTCRRTSLS